MTRCLNCSTIMLLNTSTPGGVHVGVGGGCSTLNRIQAKYLMYLKYFNYLV